MGLAAIDPHSQIGLVLTEIQAFKNVKNLQRNVWKTGQFRTLWLFPANFISKLIYLVSLVLNSLIILFQCSNFSKPV